MINGQEYSWIDIKVVIPGKTAPVDGIVGINYKHSQEKENIYGRGSKPVSRGKGRKTYEGSIILLQSEVEALQRSVGVGKDITDIPPFPIVVAYSPDGGIPTIDTLYACEFMELPKGMKEGDTHSEHEIALIIGDIVYNS